MVCPDRTRALHRENSGRIARPPGPGRAAARATHSPESPGPGGASPAFRAGAGPRRAPGLGPGTLERAGGLPTPARRARAIGAALRSRYLATVALAWWTHRGPAPMPAAVATDKSVAVLPFDNFSADKDSDRFRRRRAGRGARRPVQGSRPESDLAFLGHAVQGRAAARPARDRPDTLGVATSSKAASSTRATKSG